MKQNDILKLNSSQHLGIEQNNKLNVPGTLLTYILTNIQCYIGCELHSPVNIQYFILKITVPDTEKNTRKLIKNYIIILDFHVKMLIPIGYGTFDKISITR